MIYLEYRLKVFKTSAGLYQIDVVESPFKPASAQHRAQEFNSSIASLLARLDDDAKAESRLIGTELQELGSRLFNFLFADKIKENFRASQAIAETQRQGLRLRLQIEPPELRYLPWELLYDEDNSVFLGASPDTLLTRCPLNLTEVSRGAVSEIKVLLIAASPAPEILKKYGLPSIDAARESQYLVEALAALRAQGFSLQTKILDEVSTGAIHRELANDYAIIHFIGHSGFIDDTPVLLIHDEEGPADFIDGEKFSRLLGGRPGLQLVCLNSCSTARESSSRAFKGLAGQLVEKRIPAVVANRNPVRDDYATLFAKIFYGFLGAGFPVDVALNEARLRLFCEAEGNTADFATPVCYLVKRDGLLFDAALLNKSHQFHENLLGLRNRQFRKKRQYKFWLFGLKIFSFVQEETTGYLGQEKAAHLIKPRLAPYCSAQEKPPVLSWTAEAGVVEYEVTLFEYEAAAASKKVLHKTTPQNSLDLAQEPIALKASAKFRWQLGFWKGEEWFVENGIFWVLSDTPQQEIVAGANEFPGPGDDLETGLARCMWYFAFEFYDSVIAMAEKLLAPYADQPEALALYKCLIETYTVISRRFKNAGLYLNANQALDWASYYQALLTKSYEQ